jgi:hypothetical protein
LTGAEEDFRKNPENPEGKKVRLRSLLNFAVTNTRRTDADTAAGAIDQCTNRLQIHIPAALRNVMGVADPIAELRALSTNIANLCHTKSPNVRNKIVPCAIGLLACRVVKRYGSPKDAQAQLRHSKLEMTGWYMKQIPETVRAAVEKMDTDLCRVEIPKSQTEESIH